MSMLNDLPEFKNISKDKINDEQGGDTEQYMAMRT